MVKKDSPIKYVLILSFFIFVFELLIMIFMDDIIQFTGLPENVLDPVLLVFLLSPALFYFILVPLQKNIKEKENALDELKQANIKIAANNEDLENEVRKQTKALKKELEKNKISNEKLRLFSRGVEQSANSVIITDTKGDILYVNPKFIELTGYTFDEVKGKNPRILKTNYLSKSVYENLWKTISNGGEWTGEFRNKKKNGEIYWELASISPIKNEQGKITHYIGVKENITERKDAEQKLFDSYHKLNLVHQLMKLSVKNSSLNETLNKALKILTSIDWLKIENKGGIFLNNGNDQLNLIASNNLPASLLNICATVPFGTCLCGKAALKKEIIHADCVDDRHENKYEGITEHGHYNIPILLNEKLLGVIVLYLKQGHKSNKSEMEFLETIAATLASIIEKRKSEESIENYNIQLKEKEKELVNKAKDLEELNKSLEESKNKLKESNIAKDKFFSIISHDLKSPFFPLLGHAQSLDEMYSDLTEEEIKESIHAIKDTSEHIYALLDDLLEWARIQTDKITFNPVTINIFNLVQDIIELLKVNAQNKEISLANLIPNDVKIIGDKKMLESVLRNLVANALKFTKAGGQIEVVFEAKDETTGIISVSDNGIGMTQEELKSLFRIDVRHTTVGTNSETGTGVGLILCKEFVEKNGGKIWVESQVGKGSQFKFTVPLHT